METDGLLVLGFGGLAVALYLLERLINRRFDALERRLDALSDRTPDAHL